MRSSFGDQIDVERVRLVLAPWRGLAITIGSTVFFPKSMATVADFSACDLPLRVWFIHELAHVWQFQHRPLWTLRSWLKTLVSGGYGPSRTGYRYPHAPEWRRLNLEQQAQIIADVYRSTEGAGLPFGTDSASLETCLQQAGLSPRRVG